MSIRVIVEGDETKVRQYVRESEQDKRYKSYHTNEFLTAPSEIKVERYVERLTRRIEQQSKRRVYTLTIETSEMENTEGQEAKKIELTLLDAKMFDLLDGKVTVHGKSYDAYADPNQE